MKGRGTLAASVIGLLAVLLLTGCTNGEVGEQDSSLASGAQSGQGAAESQSSASGWDLSPRRSDAGSVAIDVQPTSLGDGQVAWGFSVALNTHSVNLDYDLKKVSALRCDRGQEHEPVSWEGSPPGGHHRQGVLRFAPLGHPSSFVEVVIKDVAGVPERVLRWEEATQ